MAQGRGMAVMGVLLSIAALLQIALAFPVVHDVGDNSTGTWNSINHPGWTVPGVANGLNISYYSDWANSNTFRQGDFLLFNYTQGQHTVVEVTQHNFDICNDTGSIREWKTGHDLVELPNVGFRYFFCGIDSHCQAGQKIRLNVLSNITGLLNETIPSVAPAISGASTLGATAAILQLGALFATLL